MGRTLTDRALDGFFNPSAREDLKGLYERLQAPNAASRPRLETVLDALYDVYGSAGLAEVLASLSDAPANAHHQFFADHVDAGGHHITANFDTCIERARSRLSPTAATRVIHFHGSLGKSADLPTLGARLAVIQNGLPARLAAALDTLIGQARLLVFVGYSGSDFFDATPFLLSRLARPGAPGIVWVDYQNRPTHPGPPAGDLTADLARRLAVKGVAVHVISGELPEILDLLAQRMGLPPSNTPPHGQRDIRTVLPDHADWQRHTATVALYNRLGYSKGVQDLLTAHAPHSPQQWAALATSRWAGGQYSQALGDWRQAFDTQSPDDRAQWDERRGAILWIRGSLIRAERHVWQAIQHWCPPGSGAAPATQATLLELYGRIVVHMRRLPDTRLLVRPARSRHVQGLLTALAERLPDTTTADLRVRVGNVQSALSGRPDIALSDHTDVLAESESLNAWLNYEHATLRSQAVAGTPPAASDLRLLHSRFVEIGAHGDAARVSLLPGATRVYRVAQVWQLWRGVDITPWNRARLVAGFAAKRWVSAAHKQMRELHATMGRGKDHARRR